MSLPPDFEHLPPAELKRLVIALLEKVAALEHTVTAQRDEIARLKNVPVRPVIKPSGMENATQPKPPTVRGVWDKIMAYVVAQGEPQLAFACIDRTVARAHQKAAGARPGKDLIEFAIHSQRGSRC